MLRLEMEDETERMRRSKMEKMREKIEAHKDDIEILYELHTRHQATVALLKEELAKKSDGISVEARNVVVGVILILGFLIYLFH